MPVVRFEGMAQELLVVLLPVIFPFYENQYNRSCNGNCPESARLDLVKTRGTRLGVGLLQALQYWCEGREERNQLGRRGQA